MNRERVKVLGVSIDNVNRAEALQRIAAFIQAARAEVDADGAGYAVEVGGRAAAHVVTANAEIVMLAANGDDMGAILAAADLVVPDGIGVVWASRVLKTPLPERVAGIDLMWETLRMCAAQGWHPFFLGAAPGVAEEAQAALEQKIPGLQCAGCHHGFFQPEDTAAIVAKINASGADLLLVALGAPRQEKWIAAHKKELHVPVAAGVGGSLDIWAGKMMRAPRWMCDIGLEWAYRLLRQPQRALRMLALPRFAWRVLWTKWRGGH